MATKKGGTPKRHFVLDVLALRVLCGRRFAAAGARTAVHLTGSERESLKAKTRARSLIGPIGVTFADAMQQPPYGYPAPPPYGSPYPPPPPQPKTSWLSRHMGLALGLGCLGFLVVVLLFVGGIFAVVTGALKSSDAYAVALSTASSDATVLAELGRPIQAGWLPNGSINVSGSTGHADLSIPVSGSVRSGKINVVADKAAGTWTFSTLNVLVDGRGTIDLLPKLPKR